MRIDFYDARITDHDRTVLVKEKGINYECQKMDSPKEISLMLKKLLHMDELAEEHVYLIALNNSCKVLGMFFLSKGTICTSLVSPREVFYGQHLSVPSRSSFATITHLETLFPANVTWN